MISALNRMTGAVVVIKPIPEHGLSRTLVGELPAIARIRHPQVVRMNREFTGTFGYTPSKSAKLNGTQSPA